MGMKQTAPKAKYPEFFLKPGLPGLKKANKPVKKLETASTSTQAPVTRSGVKPCDECGETHTTEGGPGSGPHHGEGSGSGWKANKTVGDAISNWNKKVIANKPGIKLPKESSRMKFIGRLKESSTAVGGPVGRKFRVTLLQEGLGNFGDAFYYTASAIESAVPFFEGAHCFIDHPDAVEEKIHPERSVRDLAGYFERVSAEDSDTGYKVLMGDLVLMSDPSLDIVRNQMLESITYNEKHPGEDLIGLSINADGDFYQVPMDQFLASGVVSEACKPKLLEAVSKGVTIVRPVTSIKSAVSCDVVTMAGAGGRINTLLEKGKPVKKEEGMMEEEEKKLHEEEAHKEDMGEEESPAPAAEEPAAEPAHDDAAQDEELIKSMLAKYLGDGFSDEDKSQMHQMYQEAMEMHGGDEKAAQETAGHAMKMAKHLQSKVAKAPAPAAPEAEAPMEADADGDKVAMKSKSPATVPAADAKNPIKKTDQVQESASGRMTKLVAENARLQKELNDIRTKEYLEKVLRESKLPMAATKRFRECVKGISSSKEIDSQLTLFKEAYALGGKAEGVGFIYGAEKQDVSTESNVFDSSDCVIK